MKRRSNSQKFHQRWKTKFFAFLFLGLCVGTLVLMETQYCQIKNLALLSPPAVQKPKIAFLFIARNRLPLDMVWDAFFQVSSSLTDYFVSDYFLSFVCFSRGEGLETLSCSSDPY